MAEWLYEAGIGENRAILVDGDEILEAAIELPCDLRVGAVVEARLIHVSPGRRGIVAIGKSDEALLDPLPADLTEGQALRVEIIREALAEPGRVKMPKCRPSALPLREAPKLLERISAGDFPVVVEQLHGRDRFEQAGWSELLEEASGGTIAFPGGTLLLSLTPAMTIFDVDGDLPAADLAVAGAAAAGRAIRRHAIGGSIGIDLPTLPARSDRQRAATALDAVLPQPYERTAVNGFGFLQIVRRRERTSLPELLQADGLRAAARALLRRAERAPGHGEVLIEASPQLLSHLESRPDWLELLSRRTGSSVRLQAAQLPTAVGHAQRGAA